MLWSKKVCQQDRGIKSGGPEHGYPHMLVGETTWRVLPSVAASVHIAPLEPLPCPDTTDLLIFITLFIFSSSSTWMKVSLYIRAHQAFKAINPGELE